jgi:TolB-like protein/Tfp pilus assembly protein PilF
MAIWTAEIKELERLHESFKGQLPDLEKELEQLIRTEDANVIMLYSRRCLEVIITDLCECELKRPRKTEPLKGIIDKLHKEGKVPPNIISSMHGLNELSTYGTHPKDFDPEQVKPVLSNLDIIIKWYLRYKGLGEGITLRTVEESPYEIKTHTKGIKGTLIHRNKVSIIGSGIVLFVLIIIAVLYFTNILGGSNLAKGLEKSVAILPFRNDTPVDSNKYFINGVMEDILNDLQKIKDLRVISRTSVEKYRNTTKSIPEIAKELGVNYIVEGSGEKSGNSFRLTSQLLRAKKENHLWGKTFEQEIHDAKDVFRIQSQIAESIAAELEAAITPKEKQFIEKIPTINLDAYEAVMKGNFYSGKFTKNSLDTAMTYFELAKEKDPKYAPAYIGIASVWFVRVQIGIVSFTEGSPKCEEAFMKAKELDNSVALYDWYTFDKWDWEKGEEEFKNAIERNPNDAAARSNYSGLLLILGRDEEAMKQIEIAVKLDPLNAFTTYQYGSVFMWSHKYDEAIKAYRDALKIEPNNNFAIGDLGVTFALTGMYKEAVGQWELANANSNDTELVNALKKGYSEGGYMGAQHSYLRVVESRFKNSYWPPTDIACTYALIGDNEKALYWLDQAYKVHDPPVTYLLWPGYDNLHADPRFKALCQKLKIPYK